MKVKKIALLLIAIALMVSCDSKPKNETYASSDNNPSVSLNNGIDTLSYAIGMRYSASRSDLAATLQNFGSDSTHIASLLKGLSDGLYSAKHPEQLAYYLGFESGLTLKRQILESAELQIYGTDSAGHLSIDNVIAGFHDYMNNTPKIRKGEEEMTIRELKEYIYEKIAEEQFKVASAQFAELREQNENFFLEKEQEEGMKRIDGILYKEIKPGKGPRPTKGNTVIVEYEGKLMNGSLFDKTNAPTLHPVEKEPEGLGIALRNMRPGAEWEIYVPWTLGYGAVGRGSSMPPFSTLVYHVKLINFK